MTKSNDKWVPEIGQKCEVMVQGAWRATTIVGRYEDKVIFTTPFNANKHVDWHPNGVDVYRFREIKTEAEKRREMSVGELASDIGSLSHPHSDPWGSAKKLHDKGWFKPKPLTDDVIERLIDKHQNECETLCSFEFARMIESYIHGETL